MFGDYEPDTPIEGPFAHRAPPHGARERIGAAVGWLWAPAITAIAHARHARVFHPEGITFTGHATPLEPGGGLDELAKRFDGRVLARCSSALWRHERKRDVLCIALRVRCGEGPPLDELAHKGDQDLLFATIRSQLTIPVAPLLTDATDFLGKRYWTVTPFAALGSRCELRLSPIDPPPRLGRLESRTARLLAAVRAKRASWSLEVRRAWTLRWRAIARIDLESHVAINQAVLQFDPFRSGLGVRPIGFLNATRRAAYPASRAGRPH